MSPADFLQRLDSYVEMKAREMAVRMHLTTVNDIRAQQLAERLNETREEMKEAIETLFEERKVQ